MRLRLPHLEEDYWRLCSGEEAHWQNPTTFWIPTLEERQTLRRGQAARLIFDIEAEDETGQIQSGRERMWVIVSERIGDTYIGILDNQPAMLTPGEGVYLTRGAEIPFLPEHVIDIEEPPAEYAESQLLQAPVHRWPRAEAAEPGAAVDHEPLG